MNRFLPVEVQQRTLAKPKFLDFLTGEIDELLTAVREALYRLIAVDARREYQRMLEITGKGL